MELRALHSLIAVSEVGSISAAAIQLHLTQPAVSRQIKALEEELGVQLLVRGSKLTSLTPTGEYLVKEGRKLSQYIEALPGRVATVSSGLELHIGYAPSLCRSWLPEMMQKYIKDHPHVRITLHDLSCHEMHEGVINKSLHAYICVSHPHESVQYETCNLVKYPWRLAVSQEHPLAKKKKPVTTSDLEHLALVTLSPDEFPEYWARIGEYLQKNHMKHGTLHACNSMDNAQASVASGVGAFFIAKSTSLVLSHSNQIKLLDLDKQPEAIQLCAAYRSGDISPELEDFINCLRQTLIPE